MSIDPPIDDIQHGQPATGRAGDPPRVMILACGESQRGDDGAAPRAVAALPADVTAAAAVVRCGQLEVDDLLVVPPGTACVIADAAVGIAPGDVVVASLDAIASRSSRGAPRSSHTLPPDQVIALAAALRGELPRGVFVGVGGADFRIGADLSPAVRAALPRFIAAIADEARRLAAEA